MSWKLKLPSDRYLEYVFIQSHQSLCRWPQMATIQSAWPHVANVFIDGDALLSQDSRHIMFIVLEGSRGSDMLKMWSSKTAHLSDLRNFVPFDFGIRIRVIITSQGSLPQLAQSHDVSHVTAGVASQVRIMTIGMSLFSTAPSQSHHHFVDFQVPFGCRDVGDRPCHCVTRLLNASYHGVGAIYSLTAVPWGP